MRVSVSRSLEVSAGRSGSVKNMKIYVVSCVSLSRCSGSPWWWWWCVCVWGGQGCGAAMGKWASALSPPPESSLKGVER